MAAITTPKLPPKAGYVEVERDGERVYEPTPETLERQVAEKEAQEMKTALDSIVQAIERGMSL